MHIKRCTIFITPGSCRLCWTYQYQLRSFSEMTDSFQKHYNLIKQQLIWIPNSNQRSLFLLDRKIILWEVCLYPSPNGGEPLGSLLRLAMVVKLHEHSQVFHLFFCLYQTLLVNSVSYNGMTYFIGARVMTNGTSTWRSQAFPIAVSAKLLCIRS